MKSRGTARSSRSSKVSQNSFFIFGSMSSYIQVCHCEVYRVWARKAYDSSVPRAGRDFLLYVQSYWRYTDTTVYLNLILPRLGYIQELPSTSSEKWILAGILQQIGRQFPQDKLSLQELSNVKEILDSKDISLNDLIHQPRPSFAQHLLSPPLELNERVPITFLSTPFLSQMSKMKFSFCAISVHNMCSLQRGQQQVCETSSRKRFPQM